MRHRSVIVPRLAMAGTPLSGGLAGGLASCLAVAPFAAPAAPAEKGSWFLIEPVVSSKGQQDQ